MDKVEKLRKGEKAALIGGISIVALAAIEILVGLISNAVILVSEALHNLTDSLTLFASWLGLRISRRKPTEKFPYGYYKAENLIAFFISIFILYAAIELMLEGYSKLFTSPEIKMPFQVLGITLISLLFSFFLSRYLKRIGKKINSQALIANAEERFAHVFSSIAVFVVILLATLQIPYVEGLATMLFSLIVLKAGIYSAKDSMLSLLDVAPSKELFEKVKKTILSVKGVEEVKNVKLRRAGPFVFGEAVIRVEKKIDVKKAHKIADNAERKVVEEIEEIQSLIIHIEPYEKEEMKIAVPISSDKGLNSKLMSNFGRANYFIFIYLDKRKGKIKDFYVKPNPFRKKQLRVGLHVAKFLVKERVDAVITKEIGEISFHTLTSNYIDIYKAEKGSVKHLIEDFLKGKLNVLEKPTKKEEEPPPRRGRWRIRGRPWWRGRW